MINIVKLNYIEAWHKSYAELLTRQELRKEIAELTKITRLL